MCLLVWARRKPKISRFGVIPPGKEKPRHEGGANRELFQNFSVRNVVPAMSRHRLGRLVIGAQHIFHNWTFRNPLDGGRWKIS